MKAITEKEAISFFKKNRDIKTVEAFIIDVNGLLRGKWLPVESAMKIFKAGLRLPRSAYAVDIWGQDVLGAGLVTETGDTDGLCRPVAGSLYRSGWVERPTAQVMLSMEEGDGAPFFADPRHVLAGVLARYAKRGLTPVIAAEIEFYLMLRRKSVKDAPEAPKSPKTGESRDAAQVYSIAELREFAKVIDDINHHCEKQGIPVDTTISENGPGQYEINLNHLPDALKAADYAVMMKRVIKGVADRHGLEATFMAKPYGDKSGSGMHVHFSVIDKKGHNIFAAKTPEGSPLLKHAIGGVLQTMPGCAAVFAPNLNSYRRFQPGSHAPTRIAWGYDNRSCSIRVPASDLKSTRIEHRVSGADAHPHLVFASILAGALCGIEKKIDPGSAMKGNAYASKAKSLPSFWGQSLDLFEHSDFVAEYLGKGFRHVFTACRRQEKELLDRMVSNVEYAAYLRDL